MESPIQMYKNPVRKVVNSRSAWITVAVGESEHRPPLTHLVQSLREAPVFPGDYSPWCLTPSVSQLSVDFLTGHTI